MTKYTLIYHKCWEARFLSHLELLRSLQRAFRRSGLPLLFSSGFNPRPRISFLTFPLPVGFTGEGERLEFTLADAAPADEALAALRENFRTGIVPDTVAAAETPQRQAEAPKGVGCRISFLIFLLFERDGKMNDASQATLAPPEAITLAEGLVASLVPWSGLEGRRIFAAPPQFGLEELFSAAYSLGSQASHAPLCADAAIRPDKILREILPSARSLHVHRICGEGVGAGLKPAPANMTHY